MARSITTEEAIQQLQLKAEELVRNGTPAAHRLIHLREAADATDKTIRDAELKRLLMEARRAELGTFEAITDRPLSLAPTPWLWEGLVMPEAFNLLLALPKVGKTSLVLEAIGAWAHGGPGFLGQQLHGPCPPVLIVGTDQPENDWARMLKSARLLRPDGRLALPPIVGLFTAGNPLHLDEEGIERITESAEEHPGLLVVVDSYHACCRTLGVSENDAEMADPVLALLEAIAPHKGTLLVVHHSSKGGATGSAAVASRGTSALPAAASQIIQLHRMAQANPAAAPDKRIVLKTEGRGGAPLQLLIERTDEGWHLHGDAEEVMEAQRLQEVVANLQDRQAEALEAVRDQYEQDQQPMDAVALAARLHIEGKGSRDGERKARSTLDQLVRRGLLAVEHQTTSTGRRKLYRPMRGVPLGSSHASHASQPQAMASKPLLTTGDGRVERHKRDVRKDPHPTGSGWDAAGDEDDPHWGPRL
ncbi:MAG: AAA family ATPase [Synechococcus lacustris]